MDLRRRRLPNRVLAWSTSVVGLLLVAAAAFGDDWPRLGWTVLAAAIYGAVFFALWWAGRGALGAGDVKLAPLLGLMAAWSGPSAAMLWVPLSIAALGAAAGLVAHARGHGELAFGPPMIAGAWLGMGLGLILG